MLKKPTTRTIEIPAVLEDMIAYYHEAWQARQGLRAFAA